MMYRLPSFALSRAVALGWIVAVSAFAVAWLTPKPASAFYILSPKTEPCHERLMLGSLGALGAGEAPFSDDSSVGPQFLGLLAERVESRGLPEDEGTRAFVDDIAERYGFAGRAWPEKFVLSSFVAGVRQPDTDGLSVIKFNETRSLHLQDRHQPKHSLRQTDHDYDGADAQAITRAREVVEYRLERAWASWQDDDELLERARWTFSFYGEVDVYVLAAAFEFGRAAHVIQDAYAHALRDDEMRVVAMSNFVDAVEQRYFEPRDGPAHSDRLDECDVEESAFDEMRVVEARHATIELLDVLARALEASEQDLAEQDLAKQDLAKQVQVPLDRIYDLREGCTVDNDYCGSSWAPLAASDPTEPYDLTLCTTWAPRSHQQVAGALISAAAALVWALWRLLTSRSRRSTA